MTKKTTILLWVIIAAKLLALLAGSHPFDFATYVYQARSFFEYGINPLFSWNKGLPLLGIFYGQYSLYQFAIHVLTHSRENTLLLHLFYKFVFFACDILTAYFVARIVKHITGRHELAHYSAMIWLLNPFLFWTIEFQGSYTIIAVLFSTISLFLFLRSKYVFSVILLALSASVYYYAAVFLPFYIVKRVYEAKKRGIISGVSLVLTFIATTAVLYFPYFFDSQHRRDLIGSLANHSAPNASQFATAIQLPTYSLLKFPFYLVAHYFPTNHNAPEFFRLAGILTLFGMLCIGILVFAKAKTYLRKRVYSLYVRRKTYDDERFIYDLLIAVTLFLLLIGNLQDHYLVWILPYMIICAVAYGKDHMLRNTLLLSFIVLFVILSVQNLGVYLLDLVPFGMVNIYLPQSQSLLALCGFVVMILLASNVFVARYKKTGTRFIKEEYGWAMVPVAFCVIIAMISLLTIIAAGALHTTSELGSDAIVYNYAYGPASSSELTDRTTSNIPVSDAEFKVAKIGYLKPNRFINPQNSPWFLYSWRGSANKVAAITTPGWNGSNSFTVSPSSPVAIQLNFGALRKVLPVDPYHLYNFGVYVKSDGLPTNVFRATVRFIDQYGEVIPASDARLQPSRPTTNDEWLKYSADITPPIGSRYLEPTFTVNIPRHSKIIPNNSIRFSSPSLQIVSAYKTTIYHDLVSKVARSDLEKFVLSKPSAKYFHFQIIIPRDNLAEHIQQVRFNTCTAQHVSFDDQNFEFITRFAPDCYKKGGVNSLTFTTVNYTDQPQIQVSLTHSANNVSTVNYHHSAYIILSIIGAVLMVLLLPVIIMGIRSGIAL